MHHNGSDSESSEMLNWYQLRITDIKDCFIAGLLYGPCKWVAQFKSFASFQQWNKFKPIPPFNSPLILGGGVKIKFIRKKKILLTRLYRLFSKSRIIWNWNNFEFTHASFLSLLRRWIAFSPTFRVGIVERFASASAYYVINWFALRFEISGVTCVSPRTNNVCRVRTRVRSCPTIHLHPDWISNRRWRHLHFQLIL